MLIDSLTFALGERTSSNFLRKGEKTAVVEAVFSVEDKAVFEKLKQKSKFNPRTNRNKKEEMVNIK